MSNCTFTGNSAQRNGGGIANESNDDLKIINCLLDDNRAFENAQDEFSEGGGMYSNNGSSPTVTNCTFRLNEAAYGGGIANTGGSAQVTNCVFEDNMALGAGGGMFNSSTSGLRVTACAFTGNSAQRNGGGIANESNDDLKIINCLLDNNRVFENAQDEFGNGGGMWNNNLAGGTPNDITVTNCTFSGNSAEGTGGGVHAQDDITLTLDNCIFWNNEDDSDADAVPAGPFDDESAQVHFTQTAPVVTYSDLMNLVQEGVFCPDITGDPATCDNGNIGWDPGTPADPGPHDPLFANLGGGNLHIKPGSPCIDAANNLAVPANIDTDLDGSERFLDDPDTFPDQGVTSPEHPDDIVDMGAYEFQLCPGASGTCPADLNVDGDVGPADLAGLLAAWGLNPGHVADFNCDAFVGASDLPILLASWGTCP